MNHTNQYICTTCGHLGSPIRITKGNFFTEIILFLFFIIPGLIYTAWRLSSRTYVCPKCHNSTMIPTDTPEGSRLLKSSKTFLIKQTKKEKQAIEEEELFRIKARKQLISSTQHVDKKQKRFTFGKFILIVFLLGILSSVLLPTIDSTPERITTTKIDGNIDVSRDILIDTFKKKGYFFKKEPFIDGQENYIGTKGKGEIQLLGNKENLSSANFTSYMGFDSDGTVGSSVIASSEMLLFLGTIDKTCVEWLSTQVTIATKTIESVYKKSEGYCGRQLTLYYLPGDSFSFTIESKNP